MWWSNDSATQQQRVRYDPVRIVSYDRSIPVATCPTGTSSQTYAALSVVLTRIEGGGDDGAHRGLYQVTSYRPQNGGGRYGSNVPGIRPLAYPSFQGVASSANHLGGTIIEFGGETDARGQTLVQLSQLPQRFTDNNSKKMTVITRNDIRGIQFTEHSCWC